MSTDLFEIFEQVRKIPHERYNSISDDWKYLTKLKGVSLNGKEFKGGDWTDLSPSGETFDYCRFKYAYLKSCDYSEVRFKRSGFGVCKCEEINFNLSNFESGNSFSSIFLNCSFRDSSWRYGYAFEECWFENCDLTGLALESPQSHYEKTTFKNCIMSESIAKELRSIKAIILE